MRQFQIAIRGKVLSLKGLHGIFLRHIILNRAKKHVQNCIDLVASQHLHDVFGEINSVRRRAAIDEIFHEDAVFY